MPLGGLSRTLVVWTTVQIWGTMEGTERKPGLTLGLGLSVGGTLGPVELGCIQSALLPSWRQEAPPWV